MTNLNQSSENKSFESKYVLCLLDILGFESLLNRIGLSVLHKKYDILLRQIKAIADTYGVLGDWYYWKMKNVLFSDTVLIWTEYDELWRQDPMKLSNFIRLVNEVICIGLEIGLPLRGALAFGDAILDSSSGVFLGQPLVEVARLERLQRWIGASLGPSILNDKYNLGLFPPTSVLPYKNQYKEIDNPLVTGVALDWPRVWREKRKVDPIELIQNLDMAPEFSIYYQNSLKYFDFSKNNEDWEQRKNLW